MPLLLLGKNIKIWNTWFCSETGIKQGGAQASGVDCILATFRLCIEAAWKIYVVR
jgi:hypothetical protein